nr:uncharacterized protein LOC106629844 [Zonotrichia albicollis]
MGVQQDSMLGVQQFSLQQSCWTHIECSAGPTLGVQLDPCWVFSKFYSNKAAGLTLGVQQGSLNKAAGPVLGVQLDPCWVFSRFHSKKPAGPTLDAQQNPCWVFSSFHSNKVAGPMLRVQQGSLNQAAEPMLDVQLDPCWVFSKFYSNKAAGLTLGVQQGSLNKAAGPMLGVQLDSTLGVQQFSLQQSSWTHVGCSAGPTLDAQQVSLPLSLSAFPSQASRAAASRSPCFLLHSRSPAWSVKSSSFFPLSCFAFLRLPRSKLKSFPISCSKQLLSSFWSCAARALVTHELLTFILKCSLYPHVHFLPQDAFSHITELLWYSWSCVFLFTFYLDCGVGSLGRGLSIIISLVFRFRIWGLFRGD